jgi:hypothetical protein
MVAVYDIGPTDVGLMTGTEPTGEEEGLSSITPRPARRAPRGP